MNGIVTARPKGVSAIQHNLALKIKANGLQYTKDGTDIFKLMDMLGLGWLDGMDPDQNPDGAGKIQDAVLSQLLLIEDYYGWDHKDQSQATEESVMLQFVAIWMMYRGIDRHFAKEFVTRNM